jgi:hypothetical protein
MGAENLAENTLNAQKFIWPISIQAQKFGISIKKKGFIVREMNHSFMRDPLHDDELLKNK